MVLISPSVAAETLKIVKSYDENNTKHQVEAVIEFKVLDENNKLKEGYQQHGSDYRRRNLL